MKKRLLYESIAVLRTIYDTQRGMLDASVRAQLRAVILRLEQLQEEFADTCGSDEATRSIGVLTVVWALNVYTHLIQLIKQFFAGQ